MTGADAIEIKATIPDRQIRSALRRFKLTPRNDEKRFIYFFDTPALELLAAGIIVRARRVVGDAHDSTVKFRPVDPRAVGDEWRKYPDFKIEADASEKGLVKSASFSMPAAKGLIKRVVVGKRPIEKLLTTAQHAFIEKTAKRDIDFDQLVVLGPLKAQRWRFDDPGCPWSITAELWIRADRKRLMEMSIKAPAAQAAVAVGGFMAFLAEVGAERDNEQQTKTRWAMSYYAGKHDRRSGKARSVVPKPRDAVSQRRRSATKKAAKPIAGSAAKGAPRRSIRKAARKGR